MEPLKYETSMKIEEEKTLAFPLVMLRSQIHLPPQASAESSRFHVAA